MSSHEYYMQTVTRERLQARRAEAAAHRQVSLAAGKNREVGNAARPSLSAFETVGDWIGALRLAFRRRRQTA